MLDTSKIYTSKTSGDFRIVNYISCTNVEVEFILTGYRFTAHSCAIVKGYVKDVMSPSVFGVGFIGCGPHKAKANGVITKPYNTWKGMVERCYSGKLHLKYPTYIGCTTVKEWHNFQVFAEWFAINYIEGYQLDKDIKVKGNKVYSPETCLFVTPAENTIHASAIHCRFMNPNGELVEVYNLTEFCRGKEISQGHMASVHRGERSHHKGWTKYDK